MFIGIRRSALLCIAVVSLFLIHCSNGFEQHYSDFNEFDKAATIRNKSWFPPIVYNDAYNLKNVSSLGDLLYAFGKFSYSDIRKSDSVFSSHKKIDAMLFRNKVKQHTGEMPSWFIDLDKLNAASQVIQIERFYILRQPVNKEVYFVLSN